MEELIDVKLADKIQREYVCGNCWQLLKVINYDRITKTADIVCTNSANCDGGGFVTKYYAETQRAESKLRAREFLRICGETVGIPRKRMTKKERKETIKILYG